METEGCPLGRGGGGGYMAAVGIPGPRMGQLFLVFFLPEFPKEEDMEAMVYHGMMIMS